MDTFKRHAAGGRDPDFGNDGFFTFARDIYGPLSINGLTQDADGNSVVALTRTGDGTNLYALGRLLPNGTADPGFGVDGLVTGQFSGNESSFGGIPAVTRDNGLLISGYLVPDAGGGFKPRLPAVARYLPTGIIDSGFGENGQVVFDFPPPKPVTTGADPSFGGPPDTSYEYFSFGVSPLPDGKTVFSGVIEPERDNTQSRFSVLGRLNADGSLDDSFGSQGYVYPKGARNIVDRHLVQSDGKILISGQMENVSGHLGYVARYRPDGALDLTFGMAGYLFIRDLNGGHVTAMAPYGGDKLLVGVNRPLSNGVGWHGGLWAFTDSGEPDANFNGGQPVDIVLGTSSFKMVLKDLVIDGDGVVLLGDMGNIALARYLLDGTPDVSYGNDSGWWQYSGTESYDLTRQADGKIIATGMSNAGEKFVARFLSH